MFTYRHYIYDNESQLFYLHSRYYCSQTQRFLNADLFVSKCYAIGKNIFSYCRNDYVNRVDRNGYSSSTEFPRTGTLTRWILEQIVLKLFPKDALGKRLLEHWFYGKGEKVTIDNEPDVTQYLWENDVINSNVRTAAAQQVLSNFQNFSTELSLAIDPNNGLGGASTGYNMINRCTLQLDGTYEKESDGSYTCEVSFVLSDAIDANIETDRGDAWTYGAMRMLVLNGESGRDYDLEIRGKWNFSITSDDIWEANWR